MRSGLIVVMISLWFFLAGATRMEQRILEKIDSCRG
ncbi:unnamed protein product [Nezara viridula]|uniref:Neuropeptide n=1 Tax=Nezara viridula TaxID=85310 RepID=A0A9P0HFS5_NEZVI|nr:unnamed protein product [Nezara viridula]